MNSFSDQTVEQFLWSVASDAPSPGGGAVAAIVVAQAAGLTAMAGRFTLGMAPERRSLEAGDLTEIVSAADRIRGRATALADEDAAAYEDFLRALRLPREPDPEARSAAIIRATSVAADVPLETAETAAEIGGLAVRLVEHGNRNLRADAAAAALLAASAATTAAIMVNENLAKNPDDPRRARAVTAAATARAAADRVTAAFPGIAAAVTG